MCFIRKISALALVILLVATAPLKACAANAPATAYTAKSAVLMEQSTGKILLEQNSAEHLAPASLTKIMGLILIMEAIDNERLSLEQKLTCSEYAKSMGGSEIWLKVGEQMTVDDLLKAMFVSSANDAAVVFAEAIASTEEGFVKLMNYKAAELGLKNTSFLNCTGFDEPGHYTSASDVAAMARELMKHELVTKYSTIWMDTLRGGETELVNTNRLVRFYQGTTGLKTGTTDSAGHCLCATATRNGLSLISVIMNCKTSDIRFDESKRLLDYGFTNYAIFSPQPLEANIPPVKILRGEITSTKVTHGELAGTVVKTDDINKVVQELILPDSLEAPITKEQILGHISLKINDKEIASYPLYSKQEIKRLNFFLSFKLLALELLNI